VCGSDTTRAGAARRETARHRLQVTTLIFFFVPLAATIAALIRDYSAALINNGAKSFHVVRTNMPIRG
jgi:hypothetical protein